MKRSCMSCTSEPAGGCQRVLCSPCCRRHAEGVCPGHRPEGKSKRGNRGEASRQRRFTLTKSNDIARVVHVILQSRIDRDPLSQWTKEHAIAYWLLASPSLMDERWLDQALQEDSVLRMVTMGQANAAWRQTSMLYRPHAKAKMEHMLAAAQKLFVQDGAGWSLRQGTSSLAASSGATSGVLPPRVEAATKEDQEALHAVVMEVDYDGDDVPAGGDEVPSAPARPHRGYRALMAEELWIARKNGDRPACMAECDALLNIKQTLFHKRDLVNMPEKENSEHLRFQARVGSFLWNSGSQKPAPHIRGWQHMATRGAVTVYGSKHDELIQGWCRSLDAECGKDVVGWMVPADEALPTLITWLRNRPAMWERITGMDRVYSSHFEQLGMSCSPTSLRGDPGCYWWRVGLAGEFPPQRTVGWHATSMYCLHRIVKENGPREGFASNMQGGKDVQGVFYMQGPQAHCCENYMHFSMLDDDGWLYAPLLQVAVDEEANKQSGRTCTLKRKQKQRIADAEFVDLEYVYILMVHISHLCQRDTSEWVTAEPGFHPALEIDPHEAWETIKARSKARQFMTLSKS